MRFARTLVCWSVVAAGLVGGLAARAADRPAGLRQQVIVTTGPRGLTMGTVVQALGYTQAQGATSAIVHQATVDLLMLRRGTDVVQSAPHDAGFPLSMVALSPTAARMLMGAEVAGALDDGRVVLGRTAAALRTAKVGDLMEVRGWDEQPHEVIVGAVVPDALVLDAELLMSLDSARQLAVDRPQRLLTWGFGTGRDRVLAGLRRLLPASAARVTGSWEPPGPDQVLPQAQLKQLLGEFSVARVGGDVVVDPAWTRANIVREVLPIIGARSCHRAVMGPLRAALDELASAGLAAAVNVPDSAKAGNCFNGREVRTLAGSSGRNLSRHTWAAAIDLNPSRNPYGGVPTMDPCVVAVFRSQGFAWGGSFTIPDGMHFEFVGRPLQPIVPACAIASRLANLATTTTTSTTTTLAPTTVVAPTSSTTSSLPLPTRVATTVPTLPVPAVAPPVATGIEVPTVP